MSKKIKILIFIGGPILLICILGIIFGISDYNRVKENVAPKFCVRILDKPHANETCVGIGYKIQRDVGISINQPLKKYSSQKFGSWFAKKEIYRKIDYDDYSGDYLFTFKEQKKCSKKPKLYYTDEDERDYYVYCLDELTYNIWDPSINIVDALKNKQLTIKELTDHLKVVKIYNDGGSTLYKDRGMYSKYGFAILECKANEKSTDIYIGPVFMDFEKGFCK